MELCIIQVFLVKYPVGFGKPFLDQILLNLPKVTLANHEGGAGQNFFFDDVHLPLNSHMV